MNSGDQGAADTNRRATKHGLGKPRKHETRSDTAVAALAHGRFGSHFRDAPAGWSCCCFGKVARPSARLLRLALVAAPDRADRPIDRSLQKLEPCADDHFRMTITLPLVIELLSLVGDVGGLTTGFRLTNEQRRCRQRDWRCRFGLCEFRGLYRLRYHAAARGGRRC